jgi:hypothetical protein
MTMPDYTLRTSGQICLLYQASWQLLQSLSDSSPGTVRLTPICWFGGGSCCRMLSTKVYIQPDLLILMPGDTHSSFSVFSQFPDWIGGLRMASFSFSVEQYEAAFCAVEDRLTENQMQLLKLHYSFHERPVSPKELANIIGYRRFSAVNAQYGRLASYICEYLNLEVGDETKLQILVYFSSAPYEWTMRPEVAQALERLGWVGQFTIWDEIQATKGSYEKLLPTTRKALIDSRLGQGKFRDELINYWQHCAVTGCSVVEVLRAGHIKPWRKCDDEERLNPYNGLLLTPNLDALFDRGLITFEANGKICISSKLSEEVRYQLQIDQSMSLRHITPEHQNFLQYHRDNIFLG